MRHLTAIVETGLGSVAIKCDQLTFRDFQPELLRGRLLRLITAWRSMGGGWALWLSLIGTQVALFAGVKHE
ncbi:hypothetical protein A1D17_03980 [Pseudomonas fluorescens]|uniref:Uncharacterized protein n=1 Tax=Pseudomonas fluorescens TaxID=294 RepID=A0A166QQT1_PSEFL|nr:hypothetical protein A1D17_03980 [Pseudomonas fluorescens]